MTAAKRNRLAIGLVLAVAGALGAQAPFAAAKEADSPRAHTAAAKKKSHASGAHNAKAKAKKPSTHGHATAEAAKKSHTPKAHPAKTAAKKSHTRHGHAVVVKNVPMPSRRPASLPRLAASVPLPQPTPLARAGQPLQQAALPRPVPLPKDRPQLVADRFVPVPQPPQRNDSQVSAYAEASVATRSLMFDSRAMFNPVIRPVARTFVFAPTASTSAADIDELKRVIAFARKGKEDDANAAEKAISDPVARKLAEWIILRSDNTTPSFQRYATFIDANPSWPQVTFFTRRAENALWNDKIDNATVLAFFAHRQPSTAKGRYMLARALLAKGERAAATALVRYAWRNEDCSSDVESQVLDMFGSMLTREDHKVRMERRFYADDIEAGMREAHRLGGAQLAIGRARTAVIARENKAKALLDDVPESARHDAGYIFARVQWLRRHDKPDEAAKLALTAPHNAADLVDTNKWWRETRLLVRKLLDDNHPQTAYRVAREAPTPTHDNYRVDQHFTLGWIALRYLHDPKTAAIHFARIPVGTNNPWALGRAGYWQGRAADAMGEHSEARAFYAAAAEYADTYYGQLARGRLGLPDLGLRGPPHFTARQIATLRNLEVVRAVELLYEIGERDMLPSVYYSLGETGTDVAGLSILGEIAAKHKDARSMMLLGKEAYNRGLPLGYYAYPTFGLPNYKPIAPPIGQVVAYSIARQESSFNQKDVSSANAMGLMQVTPEAGRDTAKRYKVHYDRKRLLSDSVYNMQMGAAELSNLFDGYNGSYLLTFAGYNAGRGRVQEWIGRFGDPRKPGVDPVDWVERIPFSETRNYVQRIMENLQVYRARFGGGNKLLIEADMQRGAKN
jgi:peptidoglycan lytic transglycosylase